VRPIKILQNNLSVGFEFLHARQQASVWRAVEALIHGGRLWLTALGRDMRGTALEKHRIKAADRLLGNTAIQRGLSEMYRVLAAWMLRRIARPVILVDWTGCGPEQVMLRAGLPFGGRSILLHAVVVPQSKVSRPDVHKKFLATLAKILPSHCRPIIVTDAGFHHRWFAQVRALQWDFIGRVRGGYHVTIDGEKMHFKKLFSRAKRRPIDLGLVELGAKRRDARRLVLSGKPKLKGRKRLTRKGKRGKSGFDRAHSNGAKEPQLLATSLTCCARLVVETYATRMQIEESFRDLKSHRFGWEFCSARSRNPKRIEVLMMLATLASVVLLMVGAAAERLRLERQFQANTIRKRRVLSLITLGRRIIHRAIHIASHELHAALAEIHSTLQAANPLRDLTI